MHDIDLYRREGRSERTIEIRLPELLRNIEDVFMPEKAFYLWMTRPKNASALFT